MSIDKFATYLLIYLPEKLSVAELQQSEFCCASKHSERNMFTNAGIAGRWACLFEGINGQV